MGTMDIIKTYGGEPANFLDVCYGATKGTVEKLFIITRDPNVKCILINIFGGIVRRVASGVIAAFKCQSANSGGGAPGRYKLGGSTHTCKGIRTW